METDTAGVERETSWARWWPALVVAAWNIGSAPFLTTWLIRPARRFLGNEAFVTVFAAVSLAVGVAVAGYGWVRLREDRWRRLALVAAGLAMIVLYAVASDRGSPREAVVERLHFVSYGALAALLIVACRRLGVLAPLGSLVGALAVAVADEGMQWLVPVRVGEFFDIGLNAYAALCGSLIGLGLFSTGFPHPDSLRIGWSPTSAPPRGRPTRGAVRALLSSAAVLVVGAAAFVEAAHLGHLIDDPEVGSFRSFFTRSELLERDRQTSLRWAEQPPPPLGPLQREDWYRSEAGWHVRARNEARREEDWGLAHRENLILERYYRAFLATGDENGNLHGLGVEASGRLARRAADEPMSAAAFLSEADGGRIWTRPGRGVVWTMAVVLAGGLLALRSRWRA